MEDGRPWLPGRPTAAEWRDAGRIWFRTGRWYWLSMLDPSRRILGIPGIEDENRGAWVENVARLQGLGCSLLEAHPDVPTPQEAASWRDRIDEVWLTDSTSTPFIPPPNVAVWDDLPLLDTRYQEDFSNGLGEFWEFEPERDYSNPPVLFKGFPSPRDYNRAIEEFLLLVFFRYKLAMQAGRIFYFGFSGGRPRNPV